MLPGAASPLDLGHQAERRHARAMLWLTAVPPAIFALDDALDGRPTFVIRALPALTAGGALAVLATRRADASLRDFNFWVAVAIAMSLLVSAAARPDSEDMPLRGRLLGPTLIYLLLPNSLARQTGPAIFLCIGFVVLRLLRVEGLTALQLWSDIVMVVVLNVAGVLFVRNRLRLEGALDAAWAEKSDALIEAVQARDQVRTLEGIIPVCSHCRKLRSDGGDWQLLERYLRDRTDAQFSHGVCPDCVRQHYPEIASRQR